MPSYLSPVGNEQQSDANGAPLSGGTISTYAAGTSTPIATYTSSAGDVAQSQPIELNSSGLPTLGPIWLPAGQAVKLVIKDSGGVTLRTVDNVVGVNDPTNASSVDQWVIYSGTPSYISATSFSVGGDQTNLLQVGRRVKSANTGGTVYSSITASSYSPGTGLTTVTVANDSGSLDSGLSQVSYGLLSATSGSVPRAATADVQAGTSDSLFLTPAGLRNGGLVRGTSVTASGTSIDFNSIPSWVKRITVMGAGVSTNGTSNPLVQIGDADGVEGTGYLGSGSLGGGTPTVAQFTTGFGIASGVATNVIHFAIVLTLVSAATNTWVCSGTVAASSSAGVGVTAGSKALSTTLDRVRLTTVNGTDQFDAGVVNIMYE